MNNKDPKILVRIIFLILAFFAGMFIGAISLGFVIGFFNLKLPKPVESNIVIYILTIFIPIAFGLALMKIAVVILDKFLPFNFKEKQK